MINIPIQKVLESSNVNEYLNLKFDIDNINYELINFTTISPAGFLNPVEKWLIESTFNSKKNSKKVNDNNKFFRGKKYDKYTFLKKETLIEEQIEKEFWEHLWTEIDSWETSIMNENEKK